jgi:hypothetical protein
MKPQHAGRQHKRNSSCAFCVDHDFCNQIAADFKLKGGDTTIIPKIRKILNKR